MNVNAYGGYYSSVDFNQRKTEYKKNPYSSSQIDDKEMEAVLKEKDPELLNKIKGMTSKVWNGDRGYIGFSPELKKASEYVYEARKEMGVNFSQTNSISAKNEEKLSKKAQDFLNSLREKYGDYDFMIGNGSDELNALSKSGNKEFSVILSSAEIEKMANDEKYAEEKMKGVEGAVKMCKRICEENGFASAFGSGKGENGIINKIGVSFDDNGNMKLFAELEKTSSKQKERIEKNRAKKAEDKIAEEKRAQKKNPYEKEEKNSIKRATIEASSEEEFINKLKSIDWNNINDSKSGDRFSFSV